MIPFKETIETKQELIDACRKGFDDYCAKRITKNDFLMYFGFTHGEAIIKFYGKNANNQQSLLIAGGFEPGSSAYFSAGINAWKNLKNGIYIFPPISGSGSPITKTFNLPRQTIFYGAPGTGKSYKVKIEKLAGVPEGNIFRTTFHPDSDYASFVGCYKPVEVTQNSVTGIPEIVDYNLSEDQLADVYKDLVFGKYSRNLGIGRWLYSSKYWKCFSNKYGKTSATNVMTKAGETSTAGRDTIQGAVNFYEDLENNNSAYKKEISYKFTPQVFTKAYIKAWEEMKQENLQPVYLVIEEINRGNCAQIFGDIFQLLDRNESGYSEYPIDIDEDLKNYLVQNLGADSEGIKNGKLCLPPNLNLLATMNTSDQSLFPMDSAFKRRWDWEFVPIRYSATEAKDEKDNFHTFEIEIGDKKYKWTDFLQKVNAKILSVADSEDKQMGEYFIKKSVDEKTFINKVMYYLWSEVGKDLYGSTNPFFVQKTKNENGQDVENQFSFNDLFKENATQLLQGFMEKLEVPEVNIEDEKAAATEAGEE